MMIVNRPIFIIGVGRSGSTVYFDILSYHPEVSWMSRRILNRFPDKPFLNRMLLRSIKIPLVGRIARHVFEPGECYSYWDTLFCGFSNPFRDLEAQDVSVKVKKNVVESMSQIILPEKNRLLVKITGWNRIRFLNEIFPDALFILVKRDPRAVINSFLNVPFWSGWRGPGNWRMGPISSDQEEDLKKFHYSFVALAGIKLELLEKAFAAAREYIDPENIMEVRYEDLCSSPVDTMKKSVEFCGLTWNKSFEKTVSSFKLKNTNYKWQDDLTVEQQKIVNYYYDKIGY